MNEAEFKLLIERQRSFFCSGKTLDYKFRLATLQKLKNLIKNNEARLYEALNKDLGKPAFEAYASEIGLILQEINLMIRNLKKWMQPIKVYTPLVHFIARSYYIFEPYGVVLIISPWNYPFQLLFNPLIGAVSAGNCVLAKPSQHAAHTSELMIDLINNNFSPEYIHLITTGKEIKQIILKEKYDYIFFTGSTETGKQVMKAAAETLTPVSLELGGKCPVIVTEDADIRLSAKRILWGKMLNAGQSCVAPDYILVHNKIKDNLASEMKSCIEKFYGTDPSKSPDLCKIINVSNLERINKFLINGRIIHGGESNPDNNYFSPTLLEGITHDHPSMKEEIFGPVLPLIEYNELNEAIEFITNRPRPLALYIFSNSPGKRKEIIRKTQSGAVCINDTVVYFINPNLPFGGIGRSGMGRYHGKFSFETFSYKRSVMNKSNLIDVPVRYPPYRNKLSFMRYFIR
jgi:aldehyde dehydrogenase (NAD+)